MKDKKVIKDVGLIDEGYKKSFDEAAQELLKELNNKKKLSQKDQLLRERLITYVNNPTQINMLLFTSGRFEKMKRKEEDHDD